MKRVLAVVAFAALSLAGVSHSLAHAQEAGVKPVTPAVAMNPAQICAQNWAQCSDADRLQIASVYCIDMSEADMRRFGFHSGTRQEFRNKIRERCADANGSQRPQSVSVPEQNDRIRPQDLGAVNIPGNGNTSDVDDNGEPMELAQNHRRPGGNTGSLAAEFHRINHNGRSMQLRNVHRGSSVCAPPRRLVPIMSQCTNIPGGGRRCKLGCE